MSFSEHNEVLKREISARYAVEPRDLETTLKQVKGSFPKVKRMLLVYPPKYHDITTSYGEAVALALLHRKEEAESQGWKVEIFNAAKSKDAKAELAKLVSKFKPHVVGFSSTSSSQAMSFELAKHLHSNGLGDGRVFVMGGPGTAEVHPHVQSILGNRSPIDAFFLGDGNESFSSFLENIALGDLTAARKIESVGMSSDPAVKIKAKSDVLKRKLITAREYLRTNEVAYPVILGSKVETRRKPKIARIQTMGNCAFGCGFCAISNAVGPQVRMPVETVISHMKDLVKNGIRNFYFEDATFLIDTLRDNKGAFTKTRGVEGQKFKGWSDSFLEKMTKLRAEEKAKKREIKFGIQTRLDTLNEVTIPKLAAAGCTNVFLGVETLSKRALRAMSKGTSNAEDELREKFKLLNENGINPTASLIVGQYTGQMDDLKYTLEKMRDFKAAEIFLQAAAIYPDTGDFKELPKDEQDHVTLSYLAPNHSASLVSSEHINDEDKMQYHKWDEAKDLAKYYAIVPKVLGDDYVRINPGHYLHKSIFEKHKAAFTK